MAVHQLGVFFAPILGATELVIEDGARGVFSHVPPDALVVEVHYEFEVGATRMKRAVRCIPPGLSYSDARLFGSVWFRGQTYHVLVETA
jgi:hypothetical protein